MEVATPDVHTELTAILEELRDAAPRWVALPPGELAGLLGEVRDHTLEVAEEWVARSSEAKGLPPGSPLRGEEWASGPWSLLAGLNGMIHTLEQLAAGRDPLEGKRIRTHDNGQVLVDVFPSDHWEALLLSGYTGTVWQQPGITVDNLRQHTAVRFLPGQAPEPRVGLVLGAGNINAIPALDALTEMVREGKTCLVKLNPINDYLEPLLNRAFAPLVERGFVRFVRGDGEIGAFLTEHRLVDTIHITGSARTHDRIVFGPGPEGEARKARNEPRLDKPISSELGGVGGTLVVPGPWTDRDIRFQAEHIVTQKLHNAGFNCVASQVLVVSKGWSGTPKLLAAVEDVLREVLENRPPYYPGTDQRRAVFTDAHPDATVLGQRNPFVMVKGLQPGSGDVCFREEAFGPVFAVAEIDETDPARFLERATAFANDELFGTLSSQIVIHPTTERTYAAALEQAIADLRFGAIGVNAWSGAAFLLPNATWAAFPGHTLDDVQSGIGVVHNALMFDKPQKTVVRGPFQEFPRTLARGVMHWSPKPFWFVTHAKADQVGRYLTRFEATKNPVLLAPLFAAALTG